MTDLRYPIGKFSPTETLTAEQRQRCIREIAEAPAALRSAVAGLSDAQLDTPYRPEGWTVRQVVHHIPDSHLNAYVRFKLTLTESEPTVKPYDETLWAELPDARTGEIGPSLALLESLHARWVMFLKSLKPEDFERRLNHPESGVMKLHRSLQNYAWHGRNHIAQITSLRERMKW
jgi:hypothetical protein